MLGWRCFMIEPSPYARRSLRRFTYQDAGKCSANWGGHDETFVVEAIVSEPASEFLGRTLGDEYAGDPRWPRSCPCGYAFKPDDPRQALAERLFHGFPDGRLYALRDKDLPPGAMYEAPWFAETGDVGDDGKSYVVQLPSGYEFAIDGPASNSKDGWTRTGTPPFITVRPSIHQTGHYHGYITAGLIEETVDGYVINARRTGDDPDYLECARKGAAAVAAERGMGTALIEEISPGIWQGNAEGGLLVYRSPKIRDERRIGGIVNVAKNVDQPYPDIPSLRLMMEDEVPIPLEWFDQAVDFQKALSAKNKCTLVHCAGGINRSSVTIMAMMMAWGVSFDQAWAKLPRKPWGQPIIDSLRSWAMARGR